MFDSSDDGPIEGDGPTEYLVDALPEPIVPTYCPIREGNKLTLSSGCDLCEG
jgi:hypothetical protein